MTTTLSVTGMATREAIYAALFDRVSGAAQFTTASREARHWADVAAAEMPAVFQQQGNQTIAATQAALSKRTLLCDVIIYVNAASAGDRLTVSLLNDLVDAVEVALAPPPSSPKQTLGGLVTDCRVQGTIDIHEGRNDNGALAIAVIPVEIIANV